MKTSMLKYKKNLKRISQRLRCNATDAEVIFWSKIRNKQVEGFQFYRQKPIGAYVVDFYCYKAKLVIELDGGQHFEPEHQKQDEKRDEYLKSLGLTVLRFNNLDIYNNLDGVMSVVFEFLKR